MRWAVVGLVVVAVSVGVIVRANDEVGVVERSEQDREPSRPGVSGTTSDTVPPFEVDAPEADPVRLGLFHTTADLALWRHRAQHGPYRVEGDAFPGSPGEWTAVEEDAAAVREDPESHLWALQVPDGCVQGYEGIDRSAIRDRSRTLAGAALFALVTDDAELASAVGDVLVAQTTQEGVDFADRSRWCPGIEDNRPTFALTHAMVSQLIAFDLLPEGAIEPDGAASIRDWHLGLADLIDGDFEDVHGTAFRDRDGGDHTLVGDWAQPQPIAWWNGGNARMWWGSPRVDRLHNLYNNRWSALARYQGLVGLAFSERRHQEAATLFFREFIDFGVFSSGGHPDLHRGFKDDPDADEVVLGLDYMTLAAVHAFTYVEALARAGDASLYELRSVAGAYGTEGVPEHEEAKSYGFLARTLARYADGTHERFVVEDRDPRFRLGWDRVNTGTWSRVALLSGYLRDPYLRSLYGGEGEGMPRWPADGRPQRWDAGDSGAFPAWLLLFADREDDGFDPYGLESSERVEQPAIVPRLEAQAHQPDGAWHVLHRVNAGGEALQGDGRNWSADSEASPSELVRFVQNRVEDAWVTVRGQDVPTATPTAVFATMRWQSGSVDSPLRYDLPRGPGPHRLRLYFAEREHGTGGRRFHVDVDGERAVTDLDIAGEAGGPGRALTIELNLAYAAAGLTTVELVAGAADAPVIGGLELLVLSR